MWLLVSIANITVTYCCYWSVYRWTSSVKDMRSETIASIREWASPEGWLLGCQSSDAQNWKNLQILERIKLKSAWIASLARKSDFERFIAEIWNDLFQFWCGSIQYKGLSNLNILVLTYVFRLLLYAYLYKCFCRVQSSFFCCIFLLPSAFSSLNCLFACVHISGFICFGVFLFFFFLFCSCDTMLCLLR